MLVWKQGLLGGGDRLTFCDTLLNLPRRIFNEIRVGGDRLTSRCVAVAVLRSTIQGCSFKLISFLKATTVSNSSVVNRRAFQCRQAHSGYTLIHLRNIGASGRWIRRWRWKMATHHSSTNKIHHRWSRRLTPVRLMNNTSVDEHLIDDLLHHKRPGIAICNADAINRRAKDRIRRHGVQSGTGLGCVRLSQSPAHHEWKFT